MRILGVSFQGGILMAACVLAWFMAEPFWRAMEFSAYAVGMGVLLALPMIAGAVWMAESSLTRFVQIRRDFVFVIGLFRKLTIFCGIYIMRPPVGTSQPGYPTALLLRWRIGPL
ncbi:MAG: hypothetical protein QGG73_02880 [Candidatus Hydrogenedentes bacterium]|nr:hypothetical protein [Candidatus Hydrogenedentota bacterium]